MSRSSIALTTAETLAAHLRALGITPGMDLTVHSKLISFGRIEGGAQTVLDCLRAAVGASGTLVFPTYTFDTRDKVYDPVVTPSTNVGLLGELARALPGAVRSASPLHNHVALGPRASLLADTPAMVSLGPGSDFELLHREGFRLVMLGCRFNEACTFLHHVEAMALVPYRQWLSLPRRIIDPEGGGEKAILCRYYGRKDDAWRSNFDVVASPLAATGLLMEVPAPYGRSFLVALDDLYRCATKMLNTNSYALVTESGVE